MNAEMRRIEAKCHAALGSLNLPERFSTEDLLDATSERTGREVIVRSAELSGLMPFGMVLQTATAYTILCPRNTSKLHRKHILNHEVGHVVLHLSDDPDDLEPPRDHDFERTVRQLIPDLHPDLVARLRARTTYEDTQEREAEFFATMVQGRTLHIQVPEQRVDEEFPDGLAALFDVPRRRSGVSCP
ncbi:hypothetical protein NQK81_01035 [Amycolatopsis roodepoortensis]|uniref:hypothetical protein n=1 Tax=Amycolatopsis roodepoortensis TaxID=700274 RepID=UPI00214AD0E7|nr:hypothetical protein [Amycolatopsis roodepoortensis]UUV32059.1 hypothetical protein NQK81_01035 [Amycolatopsis roodepoortensis]